MDADTAWVLVSAALVMFMVPGLALFYGGMVGTKNVLNMMNMNLYCLGIVPLLWAVAGFGFASGDWSFPLFGDFDAAWLNGVDDMVGKREFVFGMTFAAHHPRAHLRCGGGPDEVLGLGRLRAGVVVLGVLAGGLLDLRRRRLDLQASGPRLRRRHRHPHQRRRRGPWPW